MPDWKQRLIGELRRDKKKTIVLAVLLIAVLFVGVRLLRRSGTPAGAIAASWGEDLPATEASNLAAPLPGAGRVSPAYISERDAYIKEISHDISRDIFAFQTALYPPVEVPKPQPDAGHVVARDAGPPRPSIEDIVRRQSRALTLQSTIESDSPIAVINGEVLKIGEKIKGFALLEVHCHNCVLEKDGVKVRLEVP